MANEVYIAKGTALLINGEAGADYDFTVEGLSSGAGRVSEQIDLGAAPRPEEFEWSCELQWAATPNQYGTLDLYIAGAPDHDSTQIDGDIGATDAGLSDIDMLRNLRYIGSVVSENSAANEKCVTSGRFRHTMRYLSIVAVNNGGSTTHATDSNFRFDLRPIYPQGQ